MDRVNFHPLRRFSSRSSPFSSSLSRRAALFVEPSSAYESSSSRAAAGEVAELSEAAAPVFGEIAEAAPGAEIYFGNGCFWGRQHEFVEGERKRGGDADVDVTFVRHPTVE